VEFEVGFSFPIQCSTSCLLAISLAVFSGANLTTLYSHSITTNHETHFLQPLLTPHWFGFVKELKAREQIQNLTLDSISIT